MDTLEHAQLRTAQFIELLKSELLLFGVDHSTEPFISIAEKYSSVLTDPAEHYELRDHLMSAYSSSAYKHLYHKWLKATPVEPVIEAPVEAPVEVFPIVEFPVPVESAPPVEAPVDVPVEPIVEPVPEVTPAPVEEPPAV